MGNAQMYGTLVHTFNACGSSSLISCKSWL